MDLDPECGDPLCEAIEREFFPFSVDSIVNEGGCGDDEYLLRCSNVERREKARILTIESVIAAIYR